MKKGWEIKKLGDVCRFINGRAYSKHELLENGKYPVLRVGNFFTNNHWYYSDLELDEDKYCNNGDLLYAWSASFGPRIWEGGKVIYHYHIWKVVPDKNTVTKEFLFQLLRWDTESIKAAHGTGATMMHVGKGSIEKRLVPIPSLPEQQRIVSILDECFAAIDQAKANAEQNLKNARELFESYLQGVFENGKWETRKIQEIAKVINGYAFASYDFKPTNKIKSVKITNVGVKEFIEDTDNYLPEKYKETLRDFQVTEGNIVIALTRTIISSGLKVAVVPSSYDGALVNQRVAALISNEKLVNQNYLYLFLTTSYVAKYVLAHVNTLMQPNLSISDLKNMSVPVPSLKEQNNIVVKLEELRTESQKLKVLYQQKVASLEELKKSILKKAFAGELSTRDITLN